MKSFRGRPYVLSFAIDPQSRCHGNSLDEFLKLLACYPGDAPTAIGLNCGGGPESTLVELEELVGKTDLPIIVQPNAGVPKGVDGRMIYMTSAEYFSTYAKRYASLGAAAIGGCCGITPAHIEELARTIKPLMRAEKRRIPTVESAKTELSEPIPLNERSALGAKLAAGEWITLP